MEIQEIQVVDRVYKFEGKYLSMYHAVNGLGQVFTYRLYKVPVGYRVHIEGSANKLTLALPEFWVRFWYPILFKKAGLIKRIDLT